MFRETEGLLDLDELVVDYVHLVLQGRPNSKHPKTLSFVGYCRTSQQLLLQDYSFPSIILHSHR